MANKELTESSFVTILGSTAHVTQSFIIRVTWDELHQGHQGIQRCRLWAQSSIWWPGLSIQVK